MKVLLVAPPWLPVPPTGYGGTELVVDGLARGLKELGHDVTLFAAGDSTCPVTVRSFHRAALGTGRSRTTAMLAHVLAAYDAADALEPDIVHDHTIIGAYIAATMGRKAITTNHNAFDDDANATYRRIANRVPVLALSASHAKHAEGFTPFSAIHHGIDLTQYPQGPGGGGYAAFLGRIAPSKGVHIAIAAAREAGIGLRIAAKITEAAEEEYFRRIIEPQLGDGIEFLGEVGGDAKQRLLSNATCLLNPIQWDEPFGMVMIEAMACGTPVVSTARGAAPEIIDAGVTGILVDEDRELPAAIAKAATLDRSVIRRQAEERFSIQRMAADHVRVYEEVLQQ
jgi:glycosyltransferase involved in cell wall biosynthesis